MDDFKHEQPMAVRRRDEFYEFGGLRFAIWANDYGANLSVWGDPGTGEAELIRFQDYIDDPHYHAPVGGWKAFDRTKLGEPLNWWITQLRDNLKNTLEQSGFGEFVDGIDFGLISANIETLRSAMLACIPANYRYVPGFGVERTDWSSDESAFQKRNERLIDLGGLRFDIFFDRDMGVTMEVFALTNGKPVGTIRIDDYMENPHYHTPVGKWFNFDRASQGEPLAWFIDQLRNHLPELLKTSRVPQLIDKVNFKEISANADTLYKAMAARVPRGCVRTPGIGLQRISSAA